MTLRDTLYNEILPRVERPSRYLGTEYNSVHKPAEDVEVRVALVFPDLYDLGLGNLGLLILYAILNRLPWCWAERAYAPAADLENELRTRELPLFLHESKEPLTTVDLIGFTLQSELTYTNVLNILDLAGMPVRAAERDDSHPLVAGGGPTAFNPEPMAAFFDFFLLGDGEEAIVEVAEVLRATRGAPKSDKLEALARVDGVYVPTLYPMETLDDGRVVPAENGPRVVKRVVRDLDKAPFPTSYIVPFTQQIHDRIGLEVLRGCTHGCRFCQAGMTSRPVRERSLDTLERLMAGSVAETGYEEVSLLSLSTCDYSRVMGLVSRAAKQAAVHGVSVSLPSVRLDSFALELADYLTGVRRSAITVAPEAATPHLRAVINKDISDEELLETACEAFRRGWGHVKTYFMIGLPTEEDADVEAIVDLCRRTLEAGRKITSRARLNTGVSTFIPKPFTPFQWAEQIPLEEARRRQALLSEGFKKCRGVKFGRHDPRASFIEGIVTRGDRRTGGLIEAAWRRGARFESWDENLNWGAWMGAIQETGFNVDAALRARDLNERLPWDHIDTLVSKEWLREEWQRAMAGEHAPDCRRAACNQCGVNACEPELCAEMRRACREGDNHAEEASPLVLTKREEPPASQRVRVLIGRNGEARFLSHLEWVNAWTRVLRRAGAPLSYSQGFHAHPRLSFATAAPVGEESRGDLMDVVLREPVDVHDFAEQLRAAVPIGFHVSEAWEVPLKVTSLMAAVEGFSYTIQARGNEAEVSARIDDVLAVEALTVTRKGKAKKGRVPKPVKVNIRPMIAELAIEEADGDALTLRAWLNMVDGRGAKPREVVELLGLDPAATRVIKEAVHLKEDGAAGGSAG